jgi:hypothetical protein
MNRLMLMVIVAGAFLPILGAQDRRQGTLPPGPPPGPMPGTAGLIDALFVQAEMIQGGEVMFLVWIDEPDPKKFPLPSVSAKVDGKAVRAVGADRKPLDITELTKRLPTWTAVVVVHGQPPDPFFLKVLNERSVVFVVPKKLFDQMAKSAGGEPLQGWWAASATPLMIAMTPE